MPYSKKYEETLYSKDWLQKVYVEENRNAAQVAALISCTRGAVLDSLRRFDIKVKGPSEAQMLAPHPGSHSPRPRADFLGTLHDERWLRERCAEGLSGEDIAKLVGSSGSAVSYALEKAGIHRTLRESHGLPLVVPSVRQIIPRKKRSDSSGAMHARARRATPPGPCAVCGRPGDDVNHKDRTPSNNEPENRERLCRRCHRRQHAAEEQVMIEMLKELGVPYLRIHLAARERLLS